jgi:hypothetical protein
LPWELESSRKSGKVSVMERRGAMPGLKAGELCFLDGFSLKGFCQTGLSNVKLPNEPISKNRDMPVNPWVYELYAPGDRTKTNPF